MIPEHLYWGATGNSWPNAASTSDRLRSADAQRDCSATLTDWYAFGPRGEPSADWAPDRMQTDVLSAGGRACCRRRTGCRPIRWRSRREKKENENA